MKTRTDDSNIPINKRSSDINPSCYTDLLKHSKKTRIIEDSDGIKNESTTTLKTTSELFSKSSVASAANSKSSTLWKMVKEQWMDVTSQSLLPRSAHQLLNTSGRELSSKQKENILQVIHNNAI